MEQTQLIQAFFIWAMLATGVAWEGWVRAARLARVLIGARDSCKVASDTMNSMEYTLSTLRAECEDLRSRLAATTAQKDIVNTREDELWVPMREHLSVLLRVIDDLGYDVQFYEDGGRKFCKLTSRDGDSTVETDLPSLH